MMHTPPPVIALIFYLAGSVTSAATNNQADAVTPTAQWNFSPIQTTGNKVRPLAGSLSAQIQGPVAFDKQSPHALLLDGKSNLVHLTGDAAKANLPRRAFTAEAWVLLDATPDWGGIIGYLQDNGNFEKGWVLGTHRDQFTFGLSTAGADDGDGVMTYLPSRSRFEPGHWYHVVATYDGTTQKLFVDGRLKNSATTQSGDINYPASALYTIGAYRDKDETHRSTGQIAAVSVFHQALSAEQVAARFKAGKSVYPEIEPGAAVVTDWPTYMRDDARSGLTTDRLKLPLRPLWTFRAAYPPKAAWPPPAKQDFWNKKANHHPRVIFDRAYHVVSVGGRVFFGSSSDDRLYCLDANSGKVLWTFYAEGPIRLAPTLAAGRVFFGSDDGCVYCLDAVTGKRIWTFNAAPSDRRIVGNGRMISAWPVRSGVLVTGGQIRFASGLFPLQGTYQFILDAKTGKHLAQGKTSISAQGYMQRRGNQLLMAVGRAPQAFVEKLRRQGKGSGEILGNLQQNFPYALIGAGRLRFGGGENQIAAFNAADGKTVWSAKVDGRAYSLAIAGGKLLASTDRGVIYCFAAGEQAVKTVVESPPTVRTIFAKKKSAASELASYVLNRSAAADGYCLVLNPRDGALAVELARQSRLQVIVAAGEESKLAEIRRTIDRHGLADRVIVHRLKGGRLPYGDYLINLVVASTNSAVKSSEIMRVLRPGMGIAFIRRLKAWTTVTRGPLQNAGSWTHMYADPANTVCSGERHTDGPLALQWFGGPGPEPMIDRHHRTVPPLSVAGRMFVPGDDQVIAIDAYNGTQLWHKKIPNSRRIGALRDCGNMVATAERLYVAAADKCLAFDAQTGGLSETSILPRMPDGKPRDWGYLALIGSKRLGTTTKPGASRRAMSRKAIQEGTYFDFRPIVTSDSVFCHNLNIMGNTGKSLWHYKPYGAILNPTLTATADRVYFIESADPTTLKKTDGRVTLAALLGHGANLVALDLKTGLAIWKQPFDAKAIQHHLFLSYADGRLIAVGSRNQDTGQRDNKGNKIQHVWYDIHGLDAATGKRLWSQSQDNQQRADGDHGEQDHHPAIVDGVVYVEPYAYEIKTGKRRASWKLARGGHGCGTMSASANGLFFRAGNPTMCSLATGVHTKINQVSRPGCWINIIPAAGLLLIPEASSGCSCNFPLQTSMAFIAQPVRREKKKPLIDANRR